MLPAVTPIVRRARCAMWTSSPATLCAGCSLAAIAFIATASINGCWRCQPSAQWTDWNCAAEPCCKHAPILEWRTHRLWVCGAFWDSGMCNALQCSAQRNGDSVVPLERGGAHAPCLWHKRHLPSVQSARNGEAMLGWSFCHLGSLTAVCAVYSATERGLWDKQKSRKW